MCGYRSYDRVRSETYKFQDSVLLYRIEESILEIIRLNGLKSSWSLLFIIFFGYLSPFND